MIASCGLVAVLSAATGPEPVIMTSLAARSGTVITGWGPAGVRHTVTRPEPVIMRRGPVRPARRSVAYTRRVSEEIASRELRNDTAGVLRRVQAGERLTVTVNGRSVAELVPVQRARRGWIRRDELVARMRRAQADPGLRDDLARIAGDTTDDLGPIR